MQFIKTHLISLICAVVSIGLLTMAILGMMSDTVPQKLKARVSAVSAISTLSSDPKTRARITAEKRRAEEFKREFDKTLDVAKRVNAREPLIPDVFPRAKTDPTKLEFVDAYRRAMGRLRGELEAGTLPTDSEISDERTNISLRQDAEQESASGDTGELPSVDDSVNKGAGAAGTPDRGANPRIGGPGEDFNPGGDFRPPPRRGGGTPFQGGPRGGDQPRRSDEELRDDPKFRAEINKARSIRMYADPGCFHMIDLSSATVPPVELLWYAQMAYWIQQDVVNAIKQVNDSAASENSGEIFVEQSPIKRLESIHIRGYRLPTEMLAFPQDTREGSHGGSGDYAQSVSGSSNSSDDMTQASFTHRVSDSEFDVITFQVVLWIDQRRLIQFLDALKQQNFYECNLLGYTADRSEAEALGYRFGTDPVVRVVFDLEGYYSRALFKQYVPAAVASELGITADQGDSAEQG